MLKKFFDEVKPVKLGNKQFYKHVFLPGTIRSGRKGTGWHSARNYPEFIKRITRPPNRQGVYGAEWLPDGATREKYSTFPPNDINRVDFMRHVDEAWNNLTEIDIDRLGCFKLTGLDKSEICWEMIIRKEGNLFQGITAYPLWSVE